LVLAILITGISYSQGLTLFRNLGLMFISVGTFYRIQARLQQPILDYAKKTARRNREAMHAGATVGIDGSWNHRRHGSDCIVDIYDCGTGRIVDFEIVSKSNHFAHGNYEGSSNGMEVEGFKRMVGRWVPSDDKVTHVVTDKDSTLGKAIADSGWGVTHKHDTNHAMKAFEHQWDRMPKEEKKNLNGLRSRLTGWLKTTLHSDEPEDAKIAKWENARQHYRGDHSKCPDTKHEGYLWRKREEPKAQEALDRVISSGSELIRSCDPNLGSTQGNESYHAVKAKYADKRLNYPVSTPTRFGLSVIAHSNVPGWEDELRKECGVPPIPKRYQDELRRATEDRNTRAEVRRTEEYRRQRNARRHEQRSANASQRRGKDDYGKPS
jgi:hypothetical protein